VAIVEPHCYIIRPKGYLKPPFSVPQPWVTLAPTITQLWEPSRIGYWHVAQRQMLRCELIVANRPFLLVSSLPHQTLSVDKSSAWSDYYRARSRPCTPYCGVGETPNSTPNKISPRSWSNATRSPVVYRSTVTYPFSHALRELRSKGKEHKAVNPTGRVIGVVPRHRSTQIGTMNVYCMQCGSTSLPWLGPLRFYENLARVCGGLGSKSCQL